MIYKVVDVASEKGLLINAATYTLSNNFIRFFDKNNDLVAIIKFGEGMGLIIKE